MFVCEGWGVVRCVSVRGGGGCEGMWGCEGM